MAKRVRTVAFLLLLVFMLTISGVSATWRYFHVGGYAEEQVNVRFEYPNIWPKSGINTIVDGTSADNIKTLNDGSVTYDGSDTKYRWTSWSANAADKGAPVTMTIMFSEQLTFDQIKLYHFIDANGCDFPESITMSYYKAGVDGYTALTEPKDYTTSINWSDAVRNSRTGVYTMKINGTSVTFVYTYKGTAPCSTLNFNQPISANSISITFDAPAGYFVGLMEIQVLRNGVNLIS